MYNKLYLTARPMNLIDEFPEAKGFTIKGKGEAILMIHGFTSTPNAFRALALRLSEKFGWEILVPLLAGHGIAPPALNQAISEDWIRDAELAMEKLLMNFPKIHLMGISMGGPLCAHLSQRYSNNVSSLTLLAPAMYIQGFFSRILLRMIRRVLPNSILKKWIIYKKNPDLTEHISYHEYSAYSVIEFDKVCRYIKKTFQTSKPCLIFVPLNDQTIDPKSSKWFFKRTTNPKSKLIELSQSPHIVFLGKENEMIFSEIENFLKNLN